MKKETKGLGRFVFLEWLIPVVDYCATTEKNEVIFEVIIPSTVAVICATIYEVQGKTIAALIKLADILPSVISILIGFTVMFITLLLTNENQAVKRLKEYDTKKTLHKKPVYLYQKLHIQLTETLFSEISLLIIIFAFLFLLGLTSSMFIRPCVFLFLETYLSLHILLSLVRSMTHLYCAFYSADMK